MTATNCLFQTSPAGNLTGSNNLTAVNPLLDPKGLQDNGGLTETIALQPTSPAIGQVENASGLLTDQRGYGLPSGVPLDIGAYQNQAIPATSPPTATLAVVDVTPANAASEVPYSFSITFADGVAVAADSLSMSVVQVDPPGESSPIGATVVSTTPVGPTDTAGDAQEFIITYRLTPPGGVWTAADNGTYTVILGGAPITDLAGNTLAAGPLGTFTVGNSLTPTPTPTSSPTPTPTPAPTPSPTSTATPPSITIVKPLDFTVVTGHGKHAKKAMKFEGFVLIFNEALNASSAP